MTQEIEISVIVPCYNQAEFLDECITSVIEQTYKNWECIIVDDGSPDNTGEVAANLIRKDTRIKYYRKINEGVSEARNYGINVSAGKYILPLDADDKIGKHYMELALPYFRENENIKIVYCLGTQFGEKQGVCYYPDYSYERLLIRNMIFCSAFFSKQEWRNIGGYDRNLVNGLEDWEFWINMLKNGGEVIRINSVQFYYRIKEKSRNTEVKAYYDKIYDYICEKHISSYHSIIGNLIELYRENNDIKNSREYRLGKKILFLPKKAWKFTRMHIPGRKRK